MLKPIIYFAISAGTLLAQNAELPQLSDARVNIPYSELKALWQAAQREKEPPKPRPPVATALLSARYQIALQPDHADVVAEFDAQSYTDEWNVIPLIDANAQIGSIEPADAPFVLHDGRYALVTHGVGRTKLTVRFACKIDTTDDGAQLRFATPLAFINTVAVSGIPQNKMLRVDGATQISSDKDTANFRIRALDHFDIQLLSAKQLAPPVPSRWKVDAQAFVQLTDGKMSYQTRLLARTDAGSGLDIDFKLPATANVLSVKSGDIADWQARSSGDQGKLVHVRWQKRNVLNREIEIGYELPQPAAAGEWKLFPPQIENGEMTGALYAVVGEDGLELTPAVAEPLSMRLPRWVAELVGMQKFAVVGSGGVLQAKWLPLVATSPAVVENAQATMRVVNDGSLMNEMTYSIQHETPLAWQLHLPKGSELLACTVNGRQTNPIDRGGGAIELPLAASRDKSATEVKISYTARTSAFKPVSGQLSVELPLTELLIHKLEWELRIPAAYELAALEGNVESVPSSHETSDNSRAIHLRKELCKGESPRAELFYEKPETKK